LLAQNAKKTSSDKRWLPETIGKSLLFIILISGLLILLTHCAPHTNLQKTVPNRPETRVIDMKPSIVMKAVEQVLIKKKFVLNTEQTGLQHIETEWLQDSLYRSMATAEVKPITKNQCELTLLLILQKKIPFQKTWQPMEGIGTDFYDRLFDEVLMESYRTLYDGS